MVDLSKLVVVNEYQWFPPGVKEAADQLLADRVEYHGHEDQMEPCQAGPDSGPPDWKGNIAMCSRARKSKGHAKKYQTRAKNKLASASRKRNRK